MIHFLTHMFQFAEVYAVMLVWIVVPLSFYACFLCIRNHYAELFTSPVKERQQNGLDPSLP